MTLSRFDQANDSPGFLLWQLTNLWQQRIRAALAPLGITHVQFVLLASIARLAQSGTEVTQVLLARNAHTDIMMTSQVVRTLEEKGLLVRKIHPSDTRARLLSLTAEGWEITQRAFTLVESVDEQFFHPLQHDTSTLITLMQKLIASHSDSS